MPLRDFLLALTSVQHLIRGKLPLKRALIQMLTTAAMYIKIDLYTLVNGISQTAKIKLSSPVPLQNFNNIIQSGNNLNPTSSALLSPDQASSLLPSQKPLINH